MSRQQEFNADTLKAIVNALIVAKGSDYISLHADVVEFCSTGEGFENLMSKVESIRMKEQDGIRS